MTRRTKGRLPRGAHPLTLSGRVALPPSIFPWERDLIVPALTSVAEPARTVSKPEERPNHEEE